jgi:hypothetical protein
MVMLLAYTLLRRLRLNALASFSGTTFLLLSPAAAMGMLRLSTPEPVAILFLLIACHCALWKRQRSARWWFGIMLILVMWTKEIATFAFALPLLIALSEQDGILGRPQLGRAQLSYLAPSILAFVVAAVPILWVWQTSSAGSFASQYGRGGFSLLDLIGASLSAWLPFVPLAESLWVTMAVMGSFVVVLIAGWLRRPVGERERTHVLWLFVAGLSLPVFGALSFAPWPYYLLIYALPFALPASFLYAQAVSALSDGLKAERAMAVAGVVVTTTFALAQAVNDRERLSALHTAFAETVNEVASLDGIDTVLVEVSTDQYDPKSNLGPRFKAYSLLAESPWPVVRDVTCDEYLTPPGPRVLLVRLNIMCSEPKVSDTVIARRFRHFTWPNPVARIDSISFSLR